MPERSGRRRFPPQNPAAFRSFSFTQTTRLKTQRPPQPQRVRVHLLLVLPWGCEPPPAPHLCSPQPNLPPHAPNAAPPHRPPPQISTPVAAHPAPFRSGPALSPRGPASLGSPPHPNHRNPSPQRRNSNRGPAPRTLHSPANGYRREAAYGRAGAGAAGLARSVCLRRTKEPGQPQCPPRRAAHAPRPAPTAVHYGRCSPPPLDTGVAAGHRGRCRPSLTSARTTAPNMHRAGRKRKCSSRYKAAAPPCGLKGPRPA